uniref:Uncharacterized protein n=1 Tax=Arundo donax TaxID=35708 RepID=A0A0A9FFV0_ARUDO
MMVWREPLAGGQNWPTAGS